MLPEQPEDFEPSPDDLRKAEELFGRIGDDNVLSDADNLEVQRELDEPAEAEIRRRRAAILDQFFKAGDLIKLMPSNFKERESLQYILGAVVDLLRPTHYNGDPRLAKQNLERAIAALRVLRPEDEE